MAWPNTQGVALRVSLRHHDDRPNDIENDTSHGPAINVARSTYRVTQPVPGRYRTRRPSMRYTVLHAASEYTTTQLLLDGQVSTARINRMQLRI